MWEFLIIQLFLNGTKVVVFCYMSQYYLPMVVYELQNQGYKKWVYADP